MRVLKEEYWEGILRGKVFDTKIMAFPATYPYESQLSRTVGESGVGFYSHLGYEVSVV